MNQFQPEKFYHRAKVKIPKQTFRRLAMLMFMTSSEFEYVTTKIIASKPSIVAIGYESRSPIVNQRKKLEFQKLYFRRNKYYFRLFL